MVSTGSALDMLFSVNLILYNGGDNMKYIEAVRIKTYIILFKDIWQMMVWTNLDNIG